ncbi:MAG: hypothetical protein WCT14_21065 [Treponemataceae bacterium]
MLINDEVGAADVKTRIRWSSAQKGLRRRACGDGMLLNVAKSGVTIV